MQNSEEDKNNVKKAGGIAILFVVIMFIWAILGIWAFIWSIVCFGKNDKTSLNVIGLILAIFFGPFYWLYYLINKSYCRENSY